MRGFGANPLCEFAENALPVMRYSDILWVCDGFSIISCLQSFT